MQCFDAFKNLNIQLKQGGIAISPCCISPTKATAKIDFVNNEYLNTIRDNWKNNQWPAECSACNKAEQSSVNSRRIGSNQWYSDHDHATTEVKLIRLDFWTGDTCNLACAICGPYFSSRWKQELNYPIEQKKSTVNKNWTEIDLSTIEFVHFNGGEPLLSKEHVALLTAIPDKSKVHITYNTNATILPSVELMQLWEQFRLVQLDFSIDDLGTRFEYQRYPANWEQVVQNLQWFIDNAPHNCMFATNTSIGVLNHDNIDNLMTWLSANFSVNKYTDPIEHRTQLTMGVLSLESAKSSPDKIVKFLNDCDARRGTDWNTTFPNLDNYLKSTK